MLTTMWALVPFPSSIAQWQTLVDSTEATGMPRPVSVWGNDIFFSSRRRHTRLTCDWSSDVCSSDLDVDDVLDFVLLADRLALGVVRGVVNRFPEQHRHRLADVLAGEFQHVLGADRIQRHREDRKSVV